MEKERREEIKEQVAREGLSDDFSRRADALMEETLRRGALCTWPGCLSEKEKQKLDEDLARGDRGEEASKPGPDKRIECGCTAVTLPGASLE